MKVFITCLNKFIPINRTPPKPMLNIEVIQDYCTSKTHIVELYSHHFSKHSILIFERYFPSKRASLTSLSKLPKESLGDCRKEKRVVIFISSVSYSPIVRMEGRDFCGTWRGFVNKCNSKILARNKIELRKLSRDSR